MPGHRPPHLSRTAVQLQAAALASCGLWRWQLAVGHSIGTQLSSAGGSAGGLPANILEEHAGIHGRPGDAAGRLPLAGRPHLINGSLPGRVVVHAAGGRGRGARHHVCPACAQCLAMLLCSLVCCVGIHPPAIAPLSVQPAAPMPAAGAAPVVPSPADRHPGSVGVNAARHQHKPLHTAGLRRTPALGTPGEGGV